MASPDPPIASESWIEVGRLGRVHGLQGWLHIQSWCEPTEALFEHRPWRIQPTGAGAFVCDWQQFRSDGGRMQVLLKGLSSIEAASPLVGATVHVLRASLPPAGPGEHYRDDLLGFEVRNLQSQHLGLLDHFVDTPANPVMVVVAQPAEAADGAQPGPGRIADRQGGSDRNRKPDKAARPLERWVPLTPQHLHRVDLAARTVWVDWPEDF